IIWKDLLNYTYRLGPNYFTSFIIVNKAKFEELDPKVQEKLTKVARKVAEETTNTLRNNESSVTKKMADDGMIVTAAKQSDIKEGIKRLRDYWSQWAEQQGPTTDEALKKVRAAIS